MASLFVPKRRDPSKGHNHTMQIKTRENIKTYAFARTLKQTNIFLFTSTNLKKKKFKSWT